MINCLTTLMQTADVNDNIIAFPTQAEPATYKKAAKMLKDIGGKWNGGKKQFFSFEFNPISILNTFNETGVWPKKNPMAFFPTPQNVIDYILKYTIANPENHLHNKTMRILEPSAGRGNIAIALRDAYEAAGIDVEIVCVELDPINAIYLRDAGFEVIEADFLTLDIEQLGLFDLAVMNPPFKGTECARHVRHAQTFLKTYRTAICVLPTTLFNKEQSITKQLCHDASILNAGNFEECVFDDGTFEDAKVETMVVELSSGDLKGSVVKNAYAYYAECYYLSITTNSESHARYKAAETKEALRDVVNQYVPAISKADVLYGIDNEEIRESVTEMLWPQTLIEEKRYFEKHDNHNQSKDGTNTKAAAKAKTKSKKGSIEPVAANECKPKYLSIESYNAHKHRKVA